MRLVWFLILLGCGALSAPTLVQAHSILKELEDEFVKEGDMAMEMMEARPIARAILVHSPVEAAKERGYAIPGLDVPEHPSLKSPLHGSGKGADISELHTAQHASITRGIDEQIKRRCIQLLEHQRKMDRKIDDLKKAGKTENLDELLSQSDKVHALTAVMCKTPE